ncbi:hypothetical protein ANCDUO_19513 [Ancylostoma duodenale]|uniref:Uncharacterized protein n=1 Tax=Ancylostoma duodenale TaxID=51022 RepID=A0A0C2C2E4_9BILA|nr:hypothetical protein ANCDUO_19513 [Ancylostoma duodenale]
MCLFQIAVTRQGHTVDKLSPWATYVTRPKETVVYHQVWLLCIQFYNPPERYQFKHPRPSKPESLRIYEAHVGISSWEGKVNSYRAFADDVIPRIARQGIVNLGILSIVIKKAVISLFFLVIPSFLGLADSLSGGYPMYFGLNADTDSLVYLMLANDFLHKKYPQIVTIAEEVSGMPALCRPVDEGGQGFDYRLAMALPDMWIKILKHMKDEDWKINDIVHTLENRRYVSIQLVSFRWGELNVAYAESHDQALVGDKTIAFWLMDKGMIKI